MDNIEKITSQIQINLQKLLNENEKILALLSSENPELADKLIRDVNDTMSAVKTNDINKINQILDRYADNTTG